MISSSYRGGSEEHITGIMIEVILINNVCAVYKYKYIALCVAHTKKSFKTSQEWDYLYLGSMYHCCGRHLCTGACVVYCAVQASSSTHTCEQWAVLVSPRPRQWAHTVTSMQPSLASLDQAQPPDPATSPAPGGSSSSSQPLSSRQYITVKLWALCPQREMKENVGITYYRIKYRPHFKIFRVALMHLSF